jgi:CheY-like chemotaxis protein
VSVSFSPSPEGAFVRTAVKDSGRGISPEDQGRLFKPFIQLENSGALSGTGLGLALTRQLVELMGGRIGVQSAVGEGAPFYFDLATADESSPSRLITGNGPVVLVVDDDPHARELHCIALNAAGYSTLTAKSGEDALEIAKRIPLAAIVLDVHLPGVDGWHVLAQLRAHEETRHVPIVIVTVSGDRSKSIALGAEEHLSKPVERETLLQAIARCLPRRSSQAAAVEVLAIDDDLQHLELLRSTLEPRGFLVRTETTGDDALTSAKRQQPDLVLLDLILPDMSGVEVALELRKATLTMPIILLTAHELTETERLRLNHSVEAVLTKANTGPSSLVAQVEWAVR